MQEAASVVNLENTAFETTAANVSRQPVHEMEFLSCRALSRYPEDIKSPEGSVNTFPSVVGPSLTSSLK